MIHKIRSSLCDCAGRVVVFLDYIWKRPNGAYGQRYDMAIAKLVLLVFVFILQVILSAATRGNTIFQKVDFNCVPPRHKRSDSSRVTASVCKWKSQRQYTCAYETPRKR